MSTVSSRSSIGSGSDEESVHSEVYSEAGDAEERTDETDGTDAEEPPPPDSVREVYIISNEDAKEHEDAVELVNWGTFDEWKQPWHVVTLWEGSVYDEMNLWGSIPLQNDKLRKVLRFEGLLTLGCL